MTLIWSSLLNTVFLTCGVKVFAFAHISDDNITWYHNDSIAHQIQRQSTKKCAYNLLNSFFTYLRTEIFHINYNSKGREAEGTTMIWSHIRPNIYVYQDAGCKTLCKTMHGLLD